VNLRKDHCRDPDEDDRERVNETPPGRDSPRPGTVPPRRASPGAARTTDKPRRGGRQGTLTSGAEAPPPRAGRPSAPTIIGTERLSATDISALASMKNVAKCDTWCELQNPANHRVFERKLRPRPSGRGHACLGVTPSTLRAPLPRGGRRTRRMAPRAPRARTAEERAVGGRRTRRVLERDERARRRAPGHRDEAHEDPRPRRTKGSDASDRDPRSGGATRRV
jgi:hypothetical protein